MPRAVQRPKVHRTHSRFKARLVSVFDLQYQHAEAVEVWNTMKFDWVASKEWADEIYRLTHGLISVEAFYGGQRAANAIGVGVTDFIDRPRVVAALQAHTYKFADAVGKTTKKMLVETLAAGTAAGESIPMLRDRVAAVFGFSTEDNWRAERIARSETARAYTTGETELWKETGVVEAKIWDAANDACPFCLALNGKVVGLDEHFFKVGDDQSVRWRDQTIQMHHDYMDIAGPPLHPNCRCALRPQLLEIYRGKQ